MPLIDTDSLLRPIGEAEPTGTNLEYDPAFSLLERTAQGKPEQQIGETIVPGEPPDWNAVQEQAAALLGRSKDLRVVSHLLRALLHKHGFEGLTEGLAVARGLLERFWQPIHPQLDPDDGNDPTIRVSALALLSDPQIVTTLRAAPLLRSRAFGAISLRDVGIATGEIAAAADGPKVEMSTIEGAFQEATLESLDQLAASLGRATEHLQRLETLFSDQAGVSGPDTASLAQLLKQATKAVVPRLERRRAAMAEAEGTAEGGATVGATNGTGARAPLTGDISSREDVVRALDKICDYYARQEPSSPLPLLLQRCKRLATMSFMEIVREMMPDGLSQVELIAGKRDEG